MTDMSRLLLAAIKTCRFNIYRQAALYIKRVRFKRLLDARPVQRLPVGECLEGLKRELNACDDMCVCLMPEKRCVTVLCE